MTREASAAFVSFTEVLDGQHEEFERWHALDHMPEQFGIEGIVAAQRWSADPNLPAAGTDNTLAAAHHVHAYLIAEPLRPALEEMTSLAGELAAAGRWFEARRGLFNAALAVTGRWASLAVPVRPRVLPYRPNVGLHVLLLDASAAPDAAQALAEIPGVAGSWSFAALAAGLPPGLPSAPAGTGLVLAWLERDPATLVGPLAAAAGPVRFARSFRPARVPSSPAVEDAERTVS